MSNFDFREMIRFLEITAWTTLYKIYPSNRKILRSYQMEVWWEADRAHQIARERLTQMIKDLDLLADDMFEELV
jgi:hypothetical protein